VGSGRRGFMEQQLEARLLVEAEEELGLSDSVGGQGEGREAQGSEQGAPCR
jgi:hypothetical protein